MRLLIDANLSPRVAAALHRAGYDACHVVDVGLGSATDTQIVAWAAEHDHVIISSDSDSDFGAILARQCRSTPSFVLLRHVNDLTPDQQATLLLANLPAITQNLATGAVATMLRDRIRIRSLPFHPASTDNNDATTS